MLLVSFLCVVGCFHALSGQVDPKAVKAMKCTCSAYVKLCSLYYSIRLDQINQSCRQLHIELDVAAHTFSFSPWETEADRSL